MQDGPTTSYSRLTQVKRPKNTHAEVIAAGQGHTLTAAEYHAIDGGRQGLYAADPLGRI